MTAQRSYVANAWETTLTSSMGPTDTLALVVSTAGGPVSPGWLVIEPDKPSTQMEVVFFDGVFDGTTLRTTNVSKRYAAGSAAASGLTHPPGSIVRSAPTAQLVDDIFDTIAVAQTAATGAATAATDLDTRVDALEAGSGGTTATFYTTHTWALPNPAVESGDTDFIIPMEVFEVAGDVQSLAAATLKINSGTSVTLDVTVNGVPTTGFTGLSATTTKARTDPADVALADGDLVKPDISAVSGSPKGLQVTLAIKHVVTLA